MNGNKNVLSTVLCVIAALLVFCGIACMLVSLFITDTARYEKYILTDDYYNTVLRSRDKSFDELESVIEADSEKLKEYFSDDMCKNLAAEYVHAVFADIKSGAKTANCVVAESDALKKYLAESFAEYDFSQTEYASLDDAVEGAYTVICGNVNSAVRFVPDKLMTAMTELIAPLWSVMDGVATYWLAFFAVAAVLYAVAVFVLNGTSRRRNVLHAANSFWCATVAAFVPIAVLYFGTSGLILDLEENALLYFLDGFLNSMRVGMFVATLCFAAVGAVLLVAAVIYATHRTHKIEVGDPLLFSGTENA